MHKQKTYNICLVNKFYPPHTSATGDHARLLILSLMAKENLSCNVCALGIRGTSNSEVNAKVKVFRRRQLYNGKQKIIRLISSFLEGFVLIKKAAGLRADYYIVMTDPPFLNFWASFFLKKKRWAWWTMDTFPHAFVANGLVSERNFFYKYFLSRIRSHPPDLILSLGRKQGEWLSNIFDEKVPYVIIPPCLLENKSLTGETPSWYDGDRYIYFGYFGNLGEAHDDSFLLSFAQQLDPEKHRFILALSGVKSKWLLDRVRDLDHVKITSFISPFELGFIDVQLATLLSEWLHINMPSKALSALRHGHAIIYNGPEQSDIWSYIENAGWLINKDDEIALFLRQLSIDQVTIKKEKSLHLGRQFEHLLLEAHNKLINHILNGEEGE